MCHIHRRPNRHPSNAEPQAPVEAVYPNRGHTGIRQTPKTWMGGAFSVDPGTRGSARQRSGRPSSQGSRKPRPKRTSNLGATTGPGLPADPNGNDRIRDPPDNTRRDWELSWEKAKHGRELFKLGVRPGKGVLSTREGIHIAMLFMVALV